MRFIQVIAILFSACISLSFAQITYNNTSEDFYLTSELIQNATADDKAKALIQSVQDVYTQLRQVRKDVNRTVMETTLVLSRFNDIDMTEMCNNCKSYVDHIKGEANNTDSFQNLKDSLIDLCKNGTDNTICYYSIADFAQVLFNSTLEQLLDPSRFCQEFSYCPYTLQYQQVADYAAEVLADKPPTNLPIANNQTNYTFMHLTDVHVDRLYEVGSNAFCGSTQICCRLQAGSPSDPSQGAEYWGTLANCDVPYRTFEQFLQFASSNFNFDFIIWTGDNVPHDIYSQSIESQEGYTNDVTNLIRQYFPNTTVYPMFGNHEVYPMSQWDFINNSTDWLVQYLGGIWGDWLSQDAIASFVANGYYSEVNTKHNIKIIALNTEVCDTYNFWLIANPTDPDGHLAWLRQELLASEQANQGVYIMAHIPPGYSSCDSAWGARYRALADRFVNIIRGQFFGHTHNDEFEVVRSYADNSAVGVAFIAPSFTTYPYLYPSFRVFEADNDTNVLLNYYQYRLNFSKFGNDENATLEWDLAYNLKDEYNLTDISPPSILNMVQNLENNTELTSIYFNNFYAGGTSAPEFLSFNDTVHFSCHAQYSVFSDVINCMGQNASVSDLIYMAAQLLPGQWFFDNTNNA